MKKTILVPLSLSSDEQPVVEMARDLARAQGYQVLLLHVVDLNQIETAMEGAELKVGDLVDYKNQLIAQKRQEAEARLQEIAASLQADDLTVAADVEAGRPGRAIIQAANQSSDVAEIVMGSRHMPPAERLLRGSIAAKVQRMVQCSVTVVPLPART